MKETSIIKSIPVKIGGESYLLRWDKAAMFDLAAFPEATEEIDDENGILVFRRACIYAFCMIQADAPPFGSPRALAGALHDDEQEGLMEAIASAIQSGREVPNGKEEDKDPLSENGPSQGAG